MVVDRTSWGWRIVLGGDMGHSPGICSMKAQGGLSLGFHRGPEPRAGHESGCIPCLVSKGKPWFLHL